MKKAGESALLAWWLAGERELAIERVREAGSRIAIVLERDLVQFKTITVGWSLTHYFVSCGNLRARTSSETSCNWLHQRSITRSPSPRCTPLLHDLLIYAIVVSK